MTASVDNKITPVSFDELIKKEKQTESAMVAKVMEEQFRDMLDQIGNLCHQIGHTDGKGGAQQADSSSPKNALLGAKGAKPSKVGSAPPPPSDDPVKDALKHGEIFYALILLLFTGPNSDYNSLAHSMAGLNALLKKLEAAGDDVSKLQDEIKALMDGNGNPRDIAELQKQLEQLAKNNTNPKIDETLLGSIDKLVKSGGTLDQLVQEATDGKFKSFNELVPGNDPSDPGDKSSKQNHAQADAMKEIQDALNNKNGGNASKAVTELFSDLPTVMNAIQTQNQSQVQQLSLLNKQVDSDAKLLTSALTMMKAVIQSATVYSGS